LGTAAQDASDRQTELSYEITKKEKEMRAENSTATPINPNDPGHPKHPAKPSVLFACPSVCS
jgi:hypothetical protein